MVTIEEYLTEKTDNNIITNLNDFKKMNLEDVERITFTILYATDLHYDSERELCVGSLKKLREMIEYSRMANNIDLIIIGGDITDGHSQIQSTLHNISNIINILVDAAAPVLVCKGNHDSNSWYAYQNKLGEGNWISDERWYRLVTENFNRGFCFDDENKNSNYCYKDFPAKKIRVIALNTSDIPEVTDEDGKLIRESCEIWNLGISEKQLKWLAGALEFKEEGWSVIFTSHNLPFCDKKTNKSVVHNGNIAWEIIKAFKCKKKVEIHSDDDYFKVNIECDFTKNKSSDVLVYIYGHMHADMCNVYDGITCICSKDMMNAVVESIDGTMYCATLKDIPVICNESVKNNPKAHLEGGWECININPTYKTFISHRFRIPERNRHISLDI